MPCHDGTGLEGVPNGMRKARGEHLQQVSIFNFSARVGFAWLRFEENGKVCTRITVLVYWDALAAEGKGGERGSHMGPLFWEYRNTLAEEGKRTLEGRRDHILTLLQ